MNTENKLEKLIIQHPDGKRTGATPCFEFCFFYDLPRKTAKEGYAKLVTAFIECEGLNLKWFKTNTMKGCKKISGSAREQMSSFLLSVDFEKDGDLGLEQHSGPTENNYCIPSLNLFSEQVRIKGEFINRTFIRLCFPLDSANNVEKLLNYAVAYATAQPFYCGHAGFSWYWNTGDISLENEIADKKGLLLRHPCMGFSDPFTYYPFIGQGLIQVGWLTFLGNTLAKNIGSLQEIRNKLSESVNLVDLGEKNGFILVAGKKPILGSNDPKGFKSLEPYNEIGNVTKNVRLPDEIFEFMDIPGFEDEEELRAWYLRFFGEE